MQKPGVLMVPSHQRTNVIGHGKKKFTTAGRIPQAARAAMLSRLMEKRSPTGLIFTIPPTPPLQLYWKQLPTRKMEDTSIISHSPKLTQRTIEELHKIGPEPATTVVVVRGWISLSP